MTHLSIPITSAQHLAQVAIILVFVEKQNISSLPSPRSWTFSPGGLSQREVHVLVSLTLMSIPRLPAWVPSTRQGRPGQPLALALSFLPARVCGAPPAARPGLLWQIKY